MTKTTAETIRETASGYQTAKAQREEAQREAAVHDAVKRNLMDTALASQDPEIVNGTVPLFDAATQAETEALVRAETAAGEEVGFLEALLRLWAPANRDE